MLVDRGTCCVELIACYSCCVCRVCKIVLWGMKWLVGWVREDTLKFLGEAAAYRLLPLLNCMIGLKFFCSLLGVWLHSLRVGAVYCLCCFLLKLVFFFLFSVLLDCLITCRAGCWSSVDRVWL